MSEKRLRLALQLNEPPFSHYPIPYPLIPSRYRQQRRIDELLFFRPNGLISRVS
jgi:hypothetical protein